MIFLKFDSFELSGWLVALNLMEEDYDATLLRQGMELDLPRRTG